MSNEIMSFNEFVIWRESMPLPVPENMKEAYSEYLRSLAIPLHREQGEQFYCAEYDKNGYTCETQCNHCASTPAGKEGSVNYTQTVPDSHSWTSIQMLLNYLEHHKNGNVPANYLIIGLQNTKNRGYELAKPSPQSEQAGEKDAKYWYEDTEFPGQKVNMDGVREFLSDYFGANITEKKLVEVLKGVGYWHLHRLALWQAASQEKGVGWVSIADNLHENITVQTNDCTIDVLVRTDNADSPVAVAFYNKKRKEWWLSEKDDVEFTVTHWMKLPALPAPPQPNNEIK